MIWLPLLLQQPYLDHLSFIMHWPALCSPNRPTLSHLSTFILPVTLPRTHFHHILGWPASCNSGLSSAVASSRGHPWLPYLNCPPNPLVTPFISFMALFLTKLEFILFIYIYTHPLECKFIEARDFVFWFTPRYLVLRTELAHSQDSVGPQRKKASCSVFWL